jgi:hypothetical protein
METGAWQWPLQKIFFCFFFSRLGLRDRPFPSFNFFFFSSASRNLLSESSCKMMDSFLGPPSILPNHHQQLLPFPFSSRSFTSKCFFSLLLLHLDVVPTRLSSFHQQQQQQSAAEAKVEKERKEKKIPIETCLIAPLSSEVEGLPG